MSLRWLRLTAITLLVGACSQGDRPPPLGSTSKGPKPVDTTIDVDPTGPPSPDAGYLCGGRVIPLVFERPNLYFILDSSGTMGNRLTEPFGAATTLYAAARFAIEDVLHAVGHRVRYGAAVFPGGDSTADNVCRPGRQVFETQNGDDVSYALSGRNGPILQRFVRVLGDRIPSGPTTTAATLRQLRETLTELEGQTYAFLLTDGAPNCNVSLSCTADTCEANLDGRCDRTGPNCCSSDFGPLASLGCIDSEATISAVGDLAADGVSTFVIGLPGSQFFADLLDATAVAGHTARNERPYYYSVQDAAALGNTLKGLVASVAIECTIELDEIPPDPNLVNVYFDKMPIAQGTEAGWRWVDEKHIEIIGDECTLLRGGDVLLVQIAVGCPTILR